MVNASKFIEVLQGLRDVDVGATPEFVFMTAVQKQLLANSFEPGEARSLAFAEPIPLPIDATAEQLDDMGYFYAELLTECYSTLRVRGKFDEPLTEAGRLAKQLLLNRTA